MHRIVMIDNCKGEQHKPQTWRDAEPVYVDVAHEKEAWKEAKLFIGPDQTLTTFWGTWEGIRVLFLCNDNGMALNLAPNKQGTLAYLGQCVPGVMHVISGPIVGLLDSELW